MALIIKDNIIPILILIIISCGVTFFCQKDSLFNKYIIHDDCNQYIFPFYKNIDKQLFQNDFFADYSLQYNTKGIVFLYNFSTRIVDPLLFSKILPFILCSLSTFYFFLIGLKIKNIFVGFLASIIFTMHSWTFSCFSGGHAKAFAFLLAGSFIYFMISRCNILITVILVLQIFIYPPVAAISILSLLILSLFILIREPKDYPVLQGKIYLYMSFFSIMAMYVLYLLPNEFMGPLYNFREIMKMPEFFSGGRDPHFINSLSDLKNTAIAENIIGFSPYSFPFWFLATFSSIALFIKKKIKINSILNVFIISGILLFIFAWILLLKLYSPGRYLKFALITYLIFLSALVLEEIFIASISKNNIKVISLAVIAAIIIVAYRPFLFPDLRAFNNVGLYEFLSELPKDALIAGHPSEMDEIPLFSKRKVFIQRELSLPYYKNYYEEIRRRTNDFFRLYYSNSLSEVESICKNYGINYIVVKKIHFTDPYLRRSDFYLNPFNAIIKENIVANKKTGFILPHLSRDYKIYEDAEYFVIRVK